LTSAFKSWKRLFARRRRKPRLQQQLSTARGFGAEFRLWSPTPATSSSPVISIRPWPSGGFVCDLRDYPEPGAHSGAGETTVQQARFEAKGNCIKILQLALSSADYKRADDLLAKLSGTSPAIAKFVEIEKKD